MSLEDLGNLKGTTGNDIKVVSATTNTALGEANTLVLGEFDSTTDMEVSPTVQTTLNINAGNAGTNGNDVRVVSATTDTTPGASNTVILGQYDTGTDAEVDPAIRTTLTVNPGAVGDQGVPGVSTAGIFAEQSTVVPAVSYPYHLILAGDTAFTTYTTTTTTDGRGLIKFYGGDTVSGDGVSSGGSSALGTDAAATVVMSRTDRDGNTVIAVGQEQAFIDADNTFVVNNNSVDTTVTLNTFVVDGGDYTVAPFNAYVMFRVGWVSGSSVNILDADVTLDFSPEVTTTLPSPATYDAGSFSIYNSNLFITLAGATVTGVAGDYPDVNASWGQVTLT